MPTIAPRLRLSFEDSVDCDTARAVHPCNVVAFAALARSHSTVLNEPLVTALLSSEYNCATLRTEDTRKVKNTLMEAED